MISSANLIRIEENKIQINNTKLLCQKIGIEYSRAPFVGGTMFIVKSQLLNKIKSCKFFEKDFSKNNKTGDIGTLAHSLETIFGLIAQTNRHKLLGVNSYLTFLNLSKEYFNII